MPPSPERGSWPADLAEAHDPFVDEGVDDWGSDVQRPHYDYDDDGHSEPGDLETWTGDFASRAASGIDFGEAERQPGRSSSKPPVNGATAHLDPWAADARPMDDGRSPDGERVVGGLVDGAHRDDRAYRTNGHANGAAAHPEPRPSIDPSSLPRGYDDYFDDDEDELDEVEAASEATRNALEWAVVLVGAVLVALILRASLFQAFWIPSESMETTLLTNDRVLVNKVSYRLHDINRGDIVVFERPDQDPGAIRDLIKRVIALPGETVEATEGSIYINGQRLDEPYLDPGVVTDDFPPTVVPEAEIFVMGDNRANSQDSRWFGTVSEERVVGRAFVLFWPVGRVGSL